MVARRDLNTESMFAFGSRAGFWRVHRSSGRTVPLTVYAVGQALERNPEAARAMVEAGWEVASHGRRWIDYRDMPRRTSATTSHAIETIERLRSGRSAGTPAAAATRRLVVEEGGFLYDSDAYTDDLPY